MINILSILPLLSFAAAQTVPPGCDNYESCLQINDQYVASTCSPMTNATMASICICYARANRKNCFLQCTGDPVVQQAALAFENELIAACSAVGLNPKALPPAPWNTYSLTVTASSTGTASSKTSSAPSADSTKVKSSGNTLNVLGVVFGAFIGMVFAL